VVNGIFSAIIFVISCPDPIGSETTRSRAARIAGDRLPPQG
jgi:hypothetical protein